MLTQERFPALLRDLRQIDRSSARAAVPESVGERILTSFVRYFGAGEAAVYLRRDDGSLRRAAKTEAFSAPVALECEVPQQTVDARNGELASLSFIRDFDPKPELVVPLRHGRDSFGMLLYAPAAPANGEMDVLLLDAASEYAGAILKTQRLTSEAREGDFQLKYRLWELESLYDIGLSIASTLDPDRLAEEILIRTISLLNARRAALYLREGEKFLLRRSFGDVRSEFIDEYLAPDVAERLLVDSEPIRIASNADCIFPGCSSLIAIPIRTSIEMVGVLAAADKEQRDGGVGEFEENDIRLLAQFANQAAIALENARLHRDALAKQAMERELELAATIQNEILPRELPKLDGFGVAALSRPARQLGGDYYAFFERGNTLSFCVADVAGKSVPAAILVSAFHAALQLLFHEGRDLGDIATELNRHIHTWSAKNKFITLFLGTIDRSHATLHFVNAGHNPAFLLSRERSIEPLRSHGLPIGMMPGTRYTTQTTRFSGGSLVAVYSDGITEAESSGGDDFGSERLEELLRENAARSVGEIRDAIDDAVQQFTAGEPQYDDQTLVIVRTDAIG